MLRGGSDSVAAVVAGTAGRVPAMFHAADVPYLLRAGRRVLAQTRGRTVCGMLTGAGLARRWSHHRVHRFFSRARWSLDEVSAVLAGLVVDLLIPAGEPVLVAVDDTLFRRSGRTVYAAS